MAAPLLPPLLLIGPTASGKTALALALAEATGASIANADALQVYSDLRILSARPGSAELARAPHHLFGHVDASERYSTGRWLAAIGALLAELGDRPLLITGGTGLYFKALTEGLAHAPAAPAALKAELAGELAREGPERLHARLARLDPEAGARVRPSDSARIVRALELVALQGSAQAQTQRAPPLLDRWVGAALTPPVEFSRAAIDARTEAMAAAGAGAEAAALLARGLDPTLPATKALGVLPFAAAARGAMSQAAAIAETAQATRAYAKRQRTWIRHQIPGWAKIEETDLMARRELVLALWRGQAGR